MATTMTPTVRTALTVKQIVEGMLAGIRCAHCARPIETPPATDGQRLCPACEAAGETIEEAPF